MDHDGGGHSGQVGTEFSDDDIREIHRRSLAFLDHGELHGEEMQPSELQDLIDEVRADLHKGQKQARA